MHTSLCGNAYGCMTMHNADGTVGETLDYVGPTPCVRCVANALTVLSLLIPEQFEWFLGSWMTASEVEAIIAPLKNYGVNRITLTASILLAHNTR